MDRNCKLNPDAHKECTCKVYRRDVGKYEGRKLVCDVFDELLAKLKKCPLYPYRPYKISQKATGDSYIAPESTNSDKR